jgi:hypothetical protein
MAQQGASSASIELIHLQSCLLAESQIDGSPLAVLEGWSE